MCADCLRQQVHFDVISSHGVGAGARTRSGTGTDASTGTGTGAGTGSIASAPARLAGSTCAPTAHVKLVKELLG